MIGLILLGSNIGLSMFAVGFVGYAMVRNWSAAIAILRTNLLSSAMNYAMVVVPLFVLMGQFVFYAGISDGLFNATRTLFGRKPGGLAYAGIVSCTAFGAICGTLNATTATMCAVAKPIMREHKYKDSLIAGTLACGGTLGTLIPPSTPFILYGVIAEQSIGKLFAAGVVPGIIMAICFCGCIFVQTKLDPEIAPGTEEGFTIMEKVKAMKGFIPILLLFGIVVVGMFTGIFSVNESAAMGAFAAFLFLVFRGRCTKDVLLKCLKETVLTTGMTVVIIGGANIFGCFLTITHMPSNLASWIATLPLPPVLIIAVIIIIYAIMGCFVDALSMIMLTTPIFLPVITALGYDPIWFGVIVVMVLNLGAITPPVGAACFVATGALKDIPLTTVFKGALPFLWAFLISFLIVVLFPQICLWLPTLSVG